MADREHDPSTSGGAVRLLRGLVLAGLGVALFLLSVQVAAWWAQRTATAPFCGWASWLDCDAVLGSPRWSQWLGVPVVVPAVALYGLLTWAAFSVRPASHDDDAAAGQTAWWVLRAGSACAALAAVWFIYVQVGVLGRICLWCMVEHGISLALAGVVWSQPSAMSLMQRGGAVGVGLAGAALLIGGQLMMTPTYTAELVVGEVDAGGRYVEVAADAEEAVILGGGEVILSRAAHPMLGEPRARHVVVEVIDYTCPRCRRLAVMLSQAMAQLGDDYAAMVLTYPLSHRCNPVFSQTDERHAESCALAELAHAVWAVDAAAYGGFHDWLFAHQGEVDAEAARAEAERRVDPAALAEMLSGGRISDLMQRDLQIADRVEVLNLPGVLLGDQRLEALPEDAAELATVIRAAFADR